MFERYELKKAGDEYTILLYLQQGREEFARESGDPDAEANSQLEGSVREFVREHFPDLKARAAKVMLGSVMVASVSLGGASAASAATSTAHVQTGVFNDIHNSYAQTQVQDLASRGLISGYPDHTFRPQKNMTRDEFAVLLCKALGLQPVPTKQVSTIEQVYQGVESYALPYVQAVVNNGLMVGVYYGGDNAGFADFGGGQTITRQEVATILVRALALEEGAKIYNGVSTFTDASQADSYAQPNLAVAQSIGLIEGIPQQDGTRRFNPKANITREEVAVLMHKLYHNKDLLAQKGKDLFAAAPHLTANAYVNPSFLDHYTITGNGTPGETVELVVSDGTRTLTGTATVGNNGTYSSTLDLTALEEGPLTITATLTTPATHATRTATLDVIKDTKIEAPTITSDIKIDNTNETTYVVEGTGEPGATVTLNMVDKFNTALTTADRSGVVDSTGHFAITVNTKKLVNGPVTIGATSFDPAGNQSWTGTEKVTVQKNVTPTLDTPTVTFPDALTADNMASYEIVGNGTFATVRPDVVAYLTDANGNMMPAYLQSHPLMNVDTTTDGNAINFAFDLSGLPDGTYTMHVMMHDLNGNQSAEVTKDITKATAGTTAPAAPTGDTTTDTGTATDTGATGA